MTVPDRIRSSVQAAVAAPVDVDQLLRRVQDRRRSPGLLVPLAAAGAVLGLGLVAAVAVDGEPERDRVVTTASAAPTTAPSGAPYRDYLVPEGDRCGVSADYDFASDAAGGAATPDEAIAAHARGIAGSSPREQRTDDDRRQEVEIAYQLDVLDRLRQRAEQDPAAGRWDVRRADGAVDASIAVTALADGTFRVGSFDYTSVTQACAAPEGG